MHTNGVPHDYVNGRAREAHTHNHKRHVKCARNFCLVRMARGCRNNRIKCVVIRLISIFRGERYSERASGVGALFVYMRARYAPCDCQRQAFCSMFTTAVCDGFSSVVFRTFNETDANFFPPHLVLEPCVINYKTNDVCVTKKKKTKNKEVFGGRNSIRDYIIKAGRKCDPLFTFAAGPSPAGQSGKLSMNWTSCKFFGWFCVFDKKNSILKITGNWSHDKTKNARSKKSSWVTIIRCDENVRCELLQHHALKHPSMQRIKQWKIAFETKIRTRIDRARERQGNPKTSNIIIYTLSKVKGNEAN